MALTISLMEGEGVYIGPALFRVRTIHSREGFALSEVGGGLWEIVADEGTEVLPDVMVSEGPRQFSDTVRLVIQAPQEVKIVREKIAGVRDDHDQPQRGDPVLARSEGGG
jgi:hypothetical protein